MAATGLRDAIAELIRTIEKTQGIAKVYNPAPDVLAKYPCAVGYPQMQIHKHGPPELRTTLHTIIVEVHVEREQDLTKVIDQSMDFGDRVANDIFKAKQDGDYSTIGALGTIRAEYGPLGWGGVATTGWRFTFENVKVQEEIT